MNTKRIIYILAVVLILLSVTGIILTATGKDEEEVVLPTTSEPTPVTEETTKPETKFIIVAAPEQDEPFVPEWAQVKAPVAIFMGENLALDKEIVADGYQDVYVAKNANDGDYTTYWEGLSDAYPNLLTVDLGANQLVSTLKVAVNPANIWGPREQTFEVLGSTDGETFSTIYGSTAFAFDPAKGNYVLVSLFTPKEVRYVRLQFTANSGANGGQVAEVEVYAPNLAYKKAIDNNAYQDVYVAKNANDGDRNTYWEGMADAYPNQLTVDLGANGTIQCVNIKLNPQTIWSARTQTLAILGSADGTTFTPIVEAADYDFDPSSGNQISISFDPSEARYVRLEFTGNTGATGGQVAEFEVY